MNRLDPPDFDDEAALDSLSHNKMVKCYLELQKHAATIKAGYHQYVSAKGNASSVKPISLPLAVEEHLRGLYSSPPAAIGYIKRMRDESGANCCPMCGSLHCGTLDHVLPKAKYAAFAIFGRNLVPACLCNSKRTAQLIGATPEERILHPYFDDILKERLFVAHFADLGLAPKITLRPLLFTGDPNFPAVRFHLANVVERTLILQYVGKRWTAMLRRPSLTAAELRVAPASHQELHQILSAELDRQDDVQQSKNNWCSVFIAGLLDTHVLDWLITAFHRPSWQEDGPLVDGIV